MDFNISKVSFKYKFPAFVSVPEKRMTYLISFEVID